MPNKEFLLFTLIFLLLVVASCAPGPNELAVPAGRDRAVAGFWQGLWHGIITPVTFVVSLFVRRVNIYEVHNNGGWYNFGYLLGLSIILGGGGGGAASRRSR